MGVLLLHCCCLGHLLFLNFSYHLFVRLIERFQTFLRQNSLAKFRDRKSFIHFLLKICLVLLLIEGLVLVKRGKVLSLGWVLEYEGSLIVLEQGFHFLSRKILASLVSAVLMVVAAHNIPRIVLIHQSVLLIS